MSARLARPTVARGIGTAVVLSLCGAAVLAALGVIIGPAAAFRATIALTAFAYVLYLLATSAERVGRITTVLLWLTAAVIAWVLSVPLVGYVLIHAGLLWLVRSLYFAQGFVAALAELGVTLLGLAFAVWAAGRSGSPLLAFWCFFLVQAFHVLLPSTAPRHRAHGADADDPFACAQRAAEAALRRMSVAR